MSLGELQEEFMLMVGHLIIYAYSLGYRIRGGHLLRCRLCLTGAKQSVHKDKLAIDLNLFKDGQFLTDGTGHDELHDFWDQMGGAERIPNDLNHYSMEYQGRR